MDHILFLMLLAEVVEASGRITATSKRLEKIEHLASLLKRLSAEEVEPAVAFLSGATRQGRIGIGYATLRASMSAPSETPVIELLEVDRTLDDLTRVSGPGSESRKRELLNRLFSRATSAPV